VQQAEYLVQGYLRAQREWPWMGVMAVWTFRFPHPPDEPDQLGNPTRGFALVEHDFTPRPAYFALRDRAPRIKANGTGSYPLSEVQQEQIERGEPIDLVVSGERVDLLVSGSGQIERIIDGAWGDRLSFATDDDSRERVTVARGMRDTGHVISLRITGTESEPPPEVIGYVVSHIWFHSWVYPWLTGIMLVVLAGNVASLGWAGWDWRRRNVRPEDAALAARAEYHSDSETVDDVPDVTLEGSGNENDSAQPA
jgi:hypothetical protein